ncbi:MAG TPA: phosphatase PAP2 family protein [Leucothrix mucor]|uniref:undecaprenyl-diphosphate phosphatase n=1 Tax=Leucothrix mucor TaxID=45248 RepID=A0A7V2WV29_LEUMU|nr:phosphatase PAP2 family protein [Leucothrix mucor]
MLSTKFYNILIFLLLITAHTAVFWFSDIDLWVANFFYHPELSNPWSLGDKAIWRFFYQLGVPLTISVVLSTLLIILLSSIKKIGKQYRIQATFILLCFVIGPGLIVNTLFKDNWGRPRPAHNESFGGTEQYVPPLKYNTQGDGNSFPSGHSSLGFGFIAFWFLWQKRRIKWANYALAFSLSLGCLFGFARMAAGGHFLSDVFWSLWIPLLTSMGLYHFFFKKYL